MARETGRDAADSGISFNTSRRGFLGSTGLAALGAAIGGGLPLSRNGDGIPAAHAQAAAPAAAPKGPQYLKFPGKNDKLVVLGDKPLVAETPESLLDDDTTPIEKFFIRNNGQIPDETQESRRLEDHHRRRGQQQDRDHARRVEIEIQGGDAAHGAGMRRQRPRGVLAAGARQPVDQWRRRLRRMDRRAAGRCAEGRRAEEEREIHRALCRRPASVGRRQQADASRAACASRRRWTRTR